VKAIAPAPIASEGPQRSASRLAALLRAKGSSALSLRLAGLLALALAATLLLGVASASAAPPTATTEPASEVGVSATHLSGHVNPQGEAGSTPTYWHFQLSETGEPGTFAIYAGGGEISGAEAEAANPVAVSVNAENLQPGVEYFVQLVAQNEQNPESGEFANTVETQAPFPTFTTVAATVPALVANAASEVSYLRATLHGSVDPQGGNVNPTGPPGEEALPIYWYLQYREGAEGGWNTGGESVIAGSEAQSSGPIPIEATLPPHALQPSKTYEVRVFAYYLSFSREVSSSEPFPSFETLAVAKPTISINPVEPFTATTAHLSGKVNPNAPEAEGSTTPAEEEAFTTFWHFSCTPECPGLEAHELLAGKDPKEVSADVSGLIPGLEYKVTLSASNSGGEEPPAGPVSFTTLALPPQIDATFTTKVGETEATLGAKVNPQGAATTVHFEYTTTDFSSCTPTGPDCFTTPESASIGKDDADHTASAQISNLQPGTAYRYRAIATNEKSPSGLPGPAKSFHTASAAQAFSGCLNEALRRENNSTALPDCRAYEQVSPVDKGGFAAYPESALPARASPDGERISYQGYSSFPGALGNSALYSGHLSSRTASGWQTTELTPPTAKADVQRIFPVNYDFSEDLTEVVLKTPFVPLATGSVPYAFNLFLHHSGGGYSLVNAAAPKVSVKEACEPGELAGCWEYLDVVGFAGATPDFSHILFESAAQLVLPEETPPSESLYESSGGEVHLVGILPDAQLAAGAGAGAGSPSYYVSTAWETDRRVEHAISADGSRVIFSAPSDEGEANEAGQGGLPEVYDRIEGKETIELSAPTGSPENPAAAPATFWAASQDGSKVFFTSGAELTTASRTGTEGGEDLYEYDFAKPDPERLTDLTVDTNPADAESGAKVLGVVDAADDGSYVYFVAEGQLDGAKGTDGQPNLYMLHEDEAPVFVATLSGVGACNFLGAQSLDACDWTPFAPTLEAYVTPDGRHLAFMSTMSLSTANFPEGYDNTDQKTGEADSEVYVYSAPSGAEAGQLVCGSCDPSGAQPFGNILIGGISFSGVVFNGRLAVAGIGTPFFRPNALSENGARLFYTALDSNGVSRVFEYENDGEGSCAEAGGCQYQISNPESEKYSQFLGSANGGRDVFIVTPNRLVPGDVDALPDVYDAREKGGFAVPTPPPVCEGEACPGPASSPPPAPSTTTGRFLGPEEGPNHPKCARGQLKRHSRCVPRRHHKSKHHRSHTRVSHNGGGNR
jgi:hypothetical protein